jgi:ribosomal protein S18 acetylase RimI-like enzyme
VDAVSSSPPPSEVRIAEIGSDRMLAALARELFLEYEADLGIDLSFQGFAAELASLPGVYSQPAGCLLLATVAERVVGCVALRPLEPPTAELKRLYVRPAARGRGVAARLTSAALAHARSYGFERVVLDTLSTMTPALALYASLGFRDIDPYNANPLAGVRFLALDLTAAEPG